jgi:hypothetical protein
MYQIRKFDNFFIRGGMENRAKTISTDIHFKPFKPKLLSHLNYTVKKEGGRDVGV